MTSVKRREWWIIYDGVNGSPEDPTGARSTKPSGCSGGGSMASIHVAEVLPDSIEITRQELRAAMEAAKQRVVDNWQKYKDDPRKNVLTYLERELFGTGEEGGGDADAKE